MPKLKDGKHAQARRATRRAIRVAWDLVVTMQIERDSRNARSMGHRLIHVPEVKGRIGGDRSWKLVGGPHGALEKRTEVGHIGLIEGQGVLAHHGIAIDRVRAGRHARTVAKEAFLFFFLASVGLLLIAALFDPESTIR